MLYQSNFMYVGKQIHCDSGTFVRGFHCAYITLPLIIPRSYLAYRFLILFMLCQTNDNNIYAVCFASCQKNLILRLLPITPAERTFILRRPPAASYYTNPKRRVRRSAKWQLSTNATQCHSKTPTSSSIPSDLP